MIQLFKNMKPVTRIVTIICIAAIIMALIFTGQIDTVLEILK